MKTRKKFEGKTKQNRYLKRTNNNNTVAFKENREIIKKCLK